MQIIDDNIKKTLSMMLVMNLWPFLTQKFNALYFNYTILQCFV